MTVKCERVQFILCQLIFVCQHFCASKLIELHTWIPLRHFFTVGKPVFGLVAIDNIGADGHLAHALYTAGDNQILGA